MAIAKITRGRKSKRLIKYLMDDKPKVAKNGVDDRVMAVSGQNIDVEGRGYEEIDAQYQVLRELSDKVYKNHQIYHVIQSFAKDEFDFNDSLDVQRVNALGLELAKEIAGANAQITVVTQADNESALLHNHIVLGGVLLDGKSLQTNNVSVKNIREKNDEVLARHGMEQHKNIVNEEIKGRKTIAEREINQRGELTKKDIMRGKLDFALGQATSVEEFEQILQENEVDLVRGKRKKQDIFKYKEDGERAMTDRALGEAYGIDSVLQKIALNAARMEKEKEEEEREKAEKQREIEESVADADDLEDNDIELVQEAEPIQEPEKEKSSLDKIWESEVTGLSAKKHENVRVSLDDLFKEAKSLKGIDTRKSGYSGSRVPQNDVDLEL